jgi:hypothetical protein
MEAARGSGQLGAASERASQESQESKEEAADTNAPTNRPLLTTKVQQRTGLVW